MTKKIVNNGGRKEAFLNNILVSINPGESTVAEDVAVLFIDNYEDVEALEEAENVEDRVCGEAEEVSEGPGLSEQTTRVRAGKQRPTA